MSGDDEGIERDGADPTSGPSDGDRSMPGEAEAGRPDGPDMTGMDRFDVPFEEVSSAGAERSRVDGLPDGWLDEPGDADDVGDGQDLLEANHPVDDLEASGVSHSSRVQIGTGHSGITSPSDVIAPASPSHDPAIDPVDGRGPAEMPVVGEAGDGEGDGGKPFDEWRDIVAAVPDDAPSESVGFGAFVGTTEAADAAAVDSFHGDSQGIGESPADSIDVGGLSENPPTMMPAGAIVTSAPRPMKSQGVLGQVIGVVAGGVLAIPVTLAILLFGFQRDPLRITPRLPAGVRAFLPARFRAETGRRRADDEAGPPTHLTLDGIPAVPSPSLPPPGDVPPVPTSEAPPPVGGGESAPASDPDSGEPSMAVESGDVGLPAPATDNDFDSVEIVVGPLPGRDAAGPIVTTDFSALDAALAAATVASDILGNDSGGDPAGREQAQVGWYRCLSLVALEMARAERTAIASGGPPSAVVDRFEALARRVAVERREDLELLGGMWIASGKRPSEGAILIATLDAVRPVGPWWGGRLTVAGETPIGLSFLAASAPRAEPGSTVLVIGVLGDADTIWAVDVGPPPLDEDDPGGPADGGSP